MAPVFFQSLGPSEILPRHLFAEPLFAGRRVLEVGAVAATAGRSAALLRARGARRVTALDADVPAVEAARRQHASDPELRFLAGRLEDLPAEPFDLALVADAAPFQHQPSTLDVLVQRLGPSGQALLALRNPAGASLAQLAIEEPRDAPSPTWGELLALLQPRFASVELFAQSAFVGYRLGATVTGELETSVDATLTEPEECAYWVAVCGPRPSGLASCEALTLLPVAPLAIAAGRRGELAERLRFAQDELSVRRGPDGSPDGELRSRIEALEAALESSRAQVRRLERDVETLAAIERSHRERAEKAEQELRALSLRTPGA